MIAPMETSNSQQVKESPGRRSWPLALAILLVCGASVAIYSLNTSSQASEHGRRQEDCPEWCDANSCGVPACGDCPTCQAIDKVRYVVVSNASLTYLSVPVPLLPAPYTPPFSLV